MVVLVSIFVGGWLGNILNGQTLKGVVVLIGSLFFILITAGIGFLVTYPLSLADAIMGANKLEQGHHLGDWEFF